MELIKEWIFVARVGWKLEVIVFLLAMVAGIIVMKTYRLGWWMPVVVATLAAAMFTILVTALLRASE